MTRCLEDKALFLLCEGEANAEQKSHLQSCQACAKRYYEINQDLRLITQTLKQEPPPLPWTPKAPILYRSLPIAAGVLLVLALVLGDNRLWRPNFPSTKRQIAMSRSSWSRCRKLFSMADALGTLKTRNRSLTSRRCRWRWGKVVPTSAEVFSITLLPQIQNHKPSTGRS